MKYNPKIKDRSLKESLLYLIESFRYAIRGIKYAWKTEMNFRLEVLIGLLVILASLIYPLRLIDQILVYLLVTWVLVLELINTSLERIMDVVKPQKHPYIGAAKDAIAGAVLLSVAVAIVIGVIIFYPHIYRSIINYLV